MREIARLVASDRVLPDKLRAIAGQVRDMKRLWERKGCPACSAAETRKRTSSPAPCSTRRKRPPRSPRTGATCSAPSPSIGPPYWYDRREAAYDRARRRRSVSLPPFNRQSP